jgi:hypothetical protein
VKFYSFMVRDWARFGDNLYPMSKNTETVTSEERMV